MTVQVWASVLVNYSSLHHTLCVRSIKGGALLVSLAAKLQLIGWLQCSGLCWESEPSLSWGRWCSDEDLRYLDAISTTTSTTATACTTTAAMITEPEGRSTEWDSRGPSLSVYPRTGELYKASASDSAAEKEKSIRGKHLPAKRKKENRQKKNKTRSLLQQNLQTINSEMQGGKWSKENDLHACQRPLLHTFLPQFFLPPFFLILVCVATNRKVGTLKTTGNANTSNWTGSREIKKTCLRAEENQTDIKTQELRRLIFTLILTFFFCFYLALGSWKMFSVKRKKYPIGAWQVLVDSTAVPV